MWKRLIGVFCVICVVFTLLYLRIGSIATDSFYIQAAQQQSEYTLELTLNRGFIYDTNQIPLVNQSQKQVAAILVTQQNTEEVAEITDLSKDEIQQHLQNGKPFLQEVNTTKSEDDNIIVFTVLNRYEKNQTASHLVGYLSDGKGVSGLEKSYDTLLKSSEHTAKITYTLDALGRAIPGTKPKVSYTQTNNEGVVLTIDSQIQKICEEAGKKIEKGAIVVMDCKTGKLRAVCSFPSYAPNAIAQALKSQDAPMINRAFTPLSVGSTFKIAVAAAAIEQGIPASLEYDCKGSYKLGKTEMHCHNRNGHGVLKMEDALIHSCNPYFINLGLKLDKNQFLRIAKDLSYGKAYELAPGLKTQTGILPEHLSNGEMANLSFGQGDLLGTPVQLSQMVSAMVNGGITPTPSLVEGTITEQGTWKTVQDVPIGIKAVKQTTAYRLQSYLISCVEAEGQNAKSSLATAGGKTATAETGIYKNGNQMVNGWFVGFTPAEDPEYVICVVSEEAESGNITASPIFSDIAEKIALLHKLSTQSKDLSGRNSG